MYLCFFLGGNFSLCGVMTISIEQKKVLPQRKTFLAIGCAYFFVLFVRIGKMSYERVSIGKSVDPEVSTIVGGGILIERAWTDIAIHRRSIGINTEQGVAFRTLEDGLSIVGGNLYGCGTVVGTGALIGYKLVQSGPHHHHPAMPSREIEITPYMIEVGIAGGVGLDGEIGGTYGGIAEVVASTG